MKTIPPLILFVVVLALAVDLVSANNPTCYEYWDEDCQEGVQDTFHALTAGHCSDTSSSWGTVCLTEDLVALTRFDKATCQKTTGSVQPTSECVFGGQRNGRNVWIYCTAAGCDDFGATCPQVVVNQGAVKVWDTCTNRDDDYYYIDPIPTNNECYAIPDAGASVRTSCINNLYVQAIVYSDMTCTTENGAPRYLEQVDNTCYTLRGSIGSFGLSVDRQCSCEGNGDVAAPQEPTVDDNALRYDVVFNITIHGSRCLEGTALDNLTRAWKQQTRVDSIELSVGGAVLDSTRGWTINMVVRFPRILESNVFVFQQDITSEFDDGQILQMVESQCGGDNVTIVLHESQVSDHESEEQPFVNSASSMRQHVAALMMVPVVVYACLYG